MAKQPWKAWHEVVKLRDDLKSGDLPLHLFAADLYEVMMRNGKRPMYEDPDAFFALTYPTRNLRELVRDVTLRLAGKNDKAVRQLELTYGGGKTHTLITMRHLVSDPERLPDVSAVREFIEEIGYAPPKARIAALCFDKLDVETGCETRSPDGEIRVLKQPWSVLAYQLAGNAGLRLLHVEGKAEERKTPPAENTLSHLLSFPLKEGLASLILLDEVLLYAKVRCHAEPGFLDILVAFFQYLTQAAAKVEKCCIVASLLSSEPKDQADGLGKKIVADLYDIFQRQKEATIQPVEKDDVAEVLRRRLFDPQSTEMRGSWRQHIIAALKGVKALDDQIDKQGSSADDQYEKSFPFHPELTEVFYAKWSAGIERFQKTRGVLRTFAMALREAEKWDESPLIGPAVFLSPPKHAGLSEAARELVSVADTIVSDGQATKWTGILESELDGARRVQAEAVGLKLREIEQAAMTVFLHSQPTGRSAKIRDLMLLIGPCRTDRIELEKGLASWSRNSYWLDDTNTPDKESQLPGDWRLGNRPNLNQMHSAAAAQISNDVVRARLIEEIGRTRQLSQGASALGIKVHTLPSKPKDIEDDGLFHYAVMPPSAASESGKPSAETKRFIDETATPDNPRVFRNAVLLLVPSRDGLNIMDARVRDYLAWERVLEELAPKTEEERRQKGSVDASRLSTLKMHMDKAKGRIPEAIRMGYCIVVTVSESDEIQAFKFTVTDASHFETIKNDPKSRMQDMSISAEALLPGSPFALWKEGETSRRVKDLAGAFAQMPHLPKMLKSQAINETLVAGCERGVFVMRLARPDRTFRTWWRNRPDDAAMKDAAMELALPEAAELSEIASGILLPGILPELWTGEELSVRTLSDYFNGQKVVQVDKGGFSEPMVVPKATPEAVNAAVSEAVEKGRLWLLSGPTSLLAEPIPAGILSLESLLRAPPQLMAPASILSETLPDAWKGGEATALSIATHLSQKAGRNLPWKTIRDVIDAALRSRFIALAQDSSVWPCDYPSAGMVKIKMASPDIGGAAGGEGVIVVPPEPVKPGIRSAKGIFELAQMQDFAEAVPALLNIKAKTNVSMKFRVSFEVGSGLTPPSDDLIAEINKVLKDCGDGFLVE